jgi:4-phosphopantoate--beta-alanine ligase
MATIPKNHPRYFSLKTREHIAEGVQNGLVHSTGLIAHGRGEAFDYILGETTIPSADSASQIAAAALLVAQNPVISINGNVAVLSAHDCVLLANMIPANLEVNLFHRTPERIAKITAHLESAGAKNVLGRAGDAHIPGLDHDRGICDKAGIFSSDVILVPLEDGDRCTALKNMGKTVITIDLNPLSRTARTADITLVDNLIRAIPNIQKWITKLRNQDRSCLQVLIENWDNAQNLHTVREFMAKKLNSLV